MGVHWYGINQDSGYYSSLERSARNLHISAVGSPLPVVRVPSGIQYVAPMPPKGATPGDAPKRTVISPEAGRGRPLVQTCPRKRPRGHHGTAWRVDPAGERLSGGRACRVDRSGRRCVRLSVPTSSAVPLPL
jgi:hypothetical protein